MEPPVPPSQRMGVPFSSKDLTPLPDGSAIMMFGGSSNRGFDQARDGALEGGCWDQCVRSLDGNASPNPMGHGLEDAFITNGLHQVSSLEPLHLFSKFNSSALCPISDICRKAFWPGKGEGFIQLNKSDIVTPCALDGNANRRMIVFENHDPVLDEGLLVEVEPVSSLEDIDNFGVDAGYDKEGEEGEFTLKRLMLTDSNSLMRVTECNGEILSEWVLSKLGDFGPFLGMSYEGFEDEVMCLFRKIEFRRKGFGSQACVLDPLVDKKLRKELKKLESNLNYERKGGGGEECWRV